LNTIKAATDNRDLDNMLKTKMPAIGIDIGGTKIMAAAVNSEGIIGEPIKIPTPKGPENIINQFIELIEHFKKNHIIAGIGIATAGIVDSSTGTVIGATGNLPGWTGTPVQRIIESKTLLPTYIVNDANAAAYAEAHTRKLRELKCVVALTIGTGIGGGILVDGKLLNGANWGAGHCGHVKVSMDNKRLCTCGLFDCYEAYASGTGLAKTAKEILSNVSADQSPLAKNINNLKNADIFEAAAKGDIVAKQIIALWHKHLVAGMVSIAHVLNPNCFVLSGGLSNLIDYEMLSELLVDSTIPAISENLKIYRSDLGDYAGIIGAAQLILDKLAKPAA
jgi:glucokinase